MADTIKEFLVALGFKIDQDGANKFQGAIAGATTKAVALGAASIAAASAVTASVAKIAEAYNDLYFSSIKAGDSVRSVRVHQEGMRAIGINAEAASAQLEGLNLQLKFDPGKTALLNYMGIQTAGRQTKVIFEDLIGTLKRYYDQGPLGAALARNFASQFGIAESDLLKMFLMTEKNAEAQARYAAKLNATGLDVDQLAKRSNTFFLALQGLEQSLGLNAQIVADKWLPAMTDAVGFLESASDWVARLSKETDGWSSTVVSLTAALGGLQAFGWLLGMLGLKGAAAAIGGTAAAGASAIPAVAGGIGLGLAAHKADWSSLKLTGQFTEDFPAIMRTLFGGGAGAGGGDSGGGAAGGPKTRAIGGKATAASVIDYFVSKGWSREQAAGIAANLHAESGFKPGATGDGGRAYGVAQWHPDRQAAFRAWLGKDIRGSTVDEQLAFVHHELTQGGEKRAGARLRGARTAGEAGAIVSTDYERPRDVFGEATKRAQLANQMFNAPMAAPGAAGAGNQNTVNATVTVNAGTADPEQVGRAVRREVEDYARWSNATSNGQGTIR